VFLKKLPSSSVPLRSANIVGSSSVFSKSVFNVAGFLNFLATQGNVNSISNPKITTLNNKQAVIRIGKTIHYSLIPQFREVNVTTSNLKGLLDSSIDVGLVLNIVPEISEDGKIILKIYQNS